jgi:hypothetical protein
LQDAFDDRVTEIATYAKQTKVIHFEIDPEVDKKCKNGCGRDCRRKGISCFALPTSENHTRTGTTIQGKYKLNYKVSH